ncbi:MAG: DUF2066 domain-containing protein [Alphaproteobacteria bacterium]|nr:DUF2066 domain-containing protein [Alphaproteobacteria bacterium]
MALRAFLLAILVALAATPPVHAQRAGDGVFTVRGVEIDRTAPSAPQARDQGVTEGQRLAWRRLVERLVPVAGRGNLASLPAPQIAELLESYEIEAERATGNRWIGRVAYRFEAERVRNLFRTREVAYAETRARAVLIVPLLIDNGIPKLWEEENLWKRAWVALGIDDGLQPRRVPEGNLEDIATLEAAQADAGDAAALRRLAEVYQAQGAIVVRVQVDTIEGQTLAVVTFDRVGARAQDQSWQKIETLKPGEDLEAAFKRLAQEAANEIEERWKQEVLVGTGAGQGGTLRAQIRAEDIRDWVAVRARLAEVAAIRNIDVLAMGRGGLIVDVDYDGAVETLRAAMAQRELTLAADGEAWIIAIAGQATR